MFAYLETLYNTAAAASVHRPPTSAYTNPPEPQNKRNLTFCGAGVPDEHNDANPTHNVMNTQTHTHWQVLYSSRKKIEAPSGFTFVRDEGTGFADTFDRD